MTKNAQKMAQQALRALLHVAEAELPHVIDFLIAELKEIKKNVADKHDGKGVSKAAKS